MAICTGRGDVDGGHCCWIGGTVCEVLEVVDGMPRCPFMLAGAPMLGNPEWEALSVGEFFRNGFPGYDCRDWPQNIPEVMSDGVGLCCWQGDR